MDEGTQIWRLLSPERRRLTFVITRWRHKTDTMRGLLERIGNDRLGTVFPTMTLEVVKGMVLGYNNEPF